MGSNFRHFVANENNKMKKKSGKKKKKSAKGSKKKASDGDEQLEGLENADPTTLISGNEAADDGKKKKKKKGKGKKKKKLSKSERAQEKLDKAIDKFKSNDEYYDSFISHMHIWVLEKADFAIEMFKTYDVEGDGVVSYDDFKAGMFDLKIPVNKVELHLLCTLLDEDDCGEIDYTDLKSGLQYAREVRELDRQRVRDERELLITERKFPPCVCCKMSIVEPWRETVPRYVALNIRSATFDLFKKYPGHLDLLVHSHLPICGLIQLIIAETDISSTKLTVFRDRNLSAESVLAPDMTLEDCGFQGDNRDNPEDVVLYYDYKVEFKECPILLCDHYFGQKVQVSL